jgi:tetratricopeptide (TPR) repeat protein
VLVDQKVIDYFRDSMVLVKFNGREDTILAQDFRVSAYPTLVMIDKNGEEIDRIVGYREPDDFLTVLENYQKGIGTLDDLLNQVKTDSSRELYFEIGEKYKYRGGNAEAEEWFGKVIEAGEPTDSLSGESRMALAGMYRRADEYDRALAAFSEIMVDFEGQAFAVAAEIWKAITYRQKGDTAMAVQAFKDFVEHYPESEDVGYAEKQIEKLTGKAEEESE